MLGVFNVSEIIFILIGVAIVFGVKYIVANIRKGKKKKAEQELALEKEFKKIRALLSKNKGKKYTTEEIKNMLFKKKESLQEVYDFLQELAKRDELVKHDSDSLDAEDLSNEGKDVLWSYKQNK